MAALNAVIVPAKVLKGGRHKIRIAVSHNGETRYIVTDIVIDSEKEFRNGAVVRRPDAAIKNTSIRGLLDRYTKAISGIGYVQGMTCAELVAVLKDGGETHITLEDIFNEYLEIRNLKESSKTAYRQTWKVLAKSINAKTYVENISHPMVIKLTLSLKKYSSGTALNVLSLLSSILKYAERAGYAHFLINPMNGINMPKARVRDSWLSISDIKKIRDVEITNKALEKYRDLFMLSYYLGGINIIDLIKINFNECGNTLRYKRSKTERIQKINEYVEFQIPDEAKPLITKLTDETGKIKISEPQKERCLSIFLWQNAIKMQNLTGIKKIIFYSARKSFAQHAFELGIGESVVDYILGHKLDVSSKRVTFAYLYVTPQMATEAIRKVLDNLK